MEGEEDRLEDAAAVAEGVALRGGGSGADEAEEEVVGSLPVAEVEVGSLPVAGVEEVEEVDLGAEVVEEEGGDFRSVSISNLILFPGRDR